MMHVLVIRYGAIGNTLMSVPLLRALKQHDPAPVVGVVAGGAGAGALAHSPYIDTLIPYDPHGANPGMAEFLRLVRKVREFQPTHALVLKRSTRASVLAYLSGAAMRIGFTRSGPFHTRTLAYISGHPLADLYLDFARALEVDPAGTYLEVWPSAADAASVDAILREHRLSDAPFVCIHPGGASARARRWSEERFVEFARLCEKELPATPVFIGGPGDEDIIVRVRSLADSAWPVVTGLPLTATAELIRRAVLFAGSDSAPSHLAAAMHTPRIMLIGPSPKLPLNLATWGYQDPAGPPVRTLKSGLFCLECPEYPCSTERMRECASTLTAAEAFAAARSLVAHT